MVINGHVLLIGSPWIMRQGVKQVVRRIGLSIAGEGDDFGEAAAACSLSSQPTLVLVTMSHAGAFAASLGHLRAAAARFSGIKLILLADGLDATNVLDAIESGVHAVLSPNFPSHMLASSLQLVLLNQNLFPTPSGIPWVMRPIPAVPGPAPVPSSMPERHPPPVLAPVAAPAPVPVMVPVAAQTAGPVLAAARQEPVPAPRAPTAALNLVWSAQPAPTVATRGPSPSEREWDILQCLSEGGSNKSIARKLGIAETTVKVHVKSLLRKLAVANRTQAAIWALNHRRRLHEPAREAALAVPGE